MIPTFILSYEVSAVPTARRIAAFGAGATANTVRNAGANTERLVGVFDTLVPDAAGAMADVHMAGLASVEAGAAIEAGQPVTADAQGRAIPAVAAAGTTVRIIGYASQPGAAGDYIDVFLAPGIIHQA